MADAISVVARRGDAVESRHTVHAVAVVDGRVVEAAGNPDLVSYLRSSAKPLQALLLARARRDLPADELAIACASHLADAAQLDAARRLLGRSGSSEDDLACGPDGSPPSRLKHNCSGKHAGMLLTCHGRGWERCGYFSPGHPLQRELLDEVAQAAEMRPEQVATATDGCGVVTWALPLVAMARAFGRLRALDGGSEIVAAMTAHPALIRGERSPDTRLMRSLPGWVAKGGAEGVLCAGGPDGTAMALKVADGAGRAVGPATASFLGRLGHELPELSEQAILNSRGEHVGAVVTEA